MGLSSKFWQFGRESGPRAFVASRGGNVAMLWALMGAVLVGMVGLTVDFTRAQMIRTQLQNAADGAALIAERNSDQTFAHREDLAEAFFNTEAGEYAHDAQFHLYDLGENGHRVQVSYVMETTLARVVRDADWTISVESEADSSTSPNYEVSLILDTSTSMGSNNKIQALRDAANELIDLVVQVQQEPYYTKVAIVPYAMAVNVGSTYATAARGAIIGAKSLSNPANNWLASTSYNITGIAKASPCNSSSCNLTVTTSSSHGYSNNDRVYITGVSGMTQVNNTVFIVSNVTSTTFRLNTYSSGTAVNGRSYGNYTSSGAVRRCLTTNCEVVFTSSAHGFAANDYIYVTGVGGMSASNGGQAINNPTPTGTNNPTLWQVGTVVSANQFSLKGSFAPNYGSYTSGGSAYCLKSGCQYYRFTNYYSNVRVHSVSTCVSERTAHAYTDDPPTTTLLGLNYNPSGQPCPTTNAIVPLSSDLDMLHSHVNQLAASGSTGGHVGVAWGWYMLSPNFGYMLPSASVPGAYDDDEVVKVAILMTDGEYNSSYCNGVISQDSLTNSGSQTDHINCNAPNGNTYDQGEHLCDGMHDAGVIIYSVAFDFSNVPDPSKADHLLAHCADDTAHYYHADNATELVQAFHDIGKAIAQLRITH